MPPPLLLDCPKYFFVFSYQLNDKCSVLIMHQLIHVVYLILKDFDDELYKIVYVSIEHSTVNRNYFKRSYLISIHIFSFRLSISTIEEHISTAASPIRKPIKASEKECGIQCNVSFIKRQILFHNLNKLLF